MKENYKCSQITNILFTYSPKHIGSNMQTCKQLSLDQALKRIVNFLLSYFNETLLDKKLHNTYI